MNIYRHKENKKLYTIEHLLLDIHHLNNNEFAGIYAHPYNWKGDTIVYQSKSSNCCLSYVRSHFEIVSKRL